MIDNCETYSDGSTTCTCSIGQNCTFTYYERTPSEWTVLAVVCALILVWLLLLARVR